MLPGLYVPTLGPISLPLIEGSTLPALKAICEQAPLGVRDKTVVDTSYRNTWQLSHCQEEEEKERGPSRPGFTLQNPEWGEAMQRLARLCAEELGHPNASRVEARLYKLLLYEAGGFFKPHRDSEKQDGMFASLVVQLPCSYRGGELVVHHPRQQSGSKKHDFLSKTFDLSKGAAYLQYRYAAFYADCPHELKPVTEGHRLCLVYNLITRPSSAQPRDTALQAPENFSVIRRLRAILRQWGSMAQHDKTAPKRLALMLDHQYSAAGLQSCQCLKGRDRAVYNVLEEAINPSQDSDSGLPFFMDVGIVHLKESGT
ncbi:Fe2OG dioxygenase domain-containing protein [Balamuthia mandrillaris]